MDREEMNLLVEISEANFVVLETALYLDINPSDESALYLHNNASRRYHQLLNIYETRYSLLRNTSEDSCPWSYVEEPWPWDINFDFKGGM